MSFFGDRVYALEYARIMHKLTRRIMIFFSFHLALMLLLAIIIVIHFNWPQKGGEGE